MRFPALLLTTTASAIIYGVSFPPTRLRLLAWVALAPFFAAVRGASLGTALVLGWLWTVMAAYVVGDWFPRSVSGYYGQPAYVGIAFFFGVSSLLAAPYYMAFAVAYRRLARRGPTVWGPLLAGAAWAAAELARVWLGGNPWAVSGYSQVGMDPLVQIADVTGVYGLSFLIGAANAALVELWLAARYDRQRWRTALRGAAAVVGTLAIGLGYGAVRLHSDLIDRQAAPVRVAMVQANLDLGAQWRQEFYGRNLDVHLRLTHQVLSERRPQLVFWPENALTFFVADEPLYRAAIARVLWPGGAQLVTGGLRTEGGAVMPRYYNSVFLLSPRGEIIGTYDKQKLVPFAEYFPLPRVEGLVRRFARARTLTPGEPRPLLETVGGRAGVTICNEAMFPEFAAARVRAGAGFLVDPANDTWLTPEFSAQQFEIVSLRAIEQRRYIVRASTSGPSAIVDPYGHVPERTEFFTRAAITGDIRPSALVTPYCRIGDLFGIACAIVALAACLAPAARRAGDDAA
jgi:apolipoprotein N-acyltransferase